MKAKLFFTVILFLSVAVFLLSMSSSKVYPPAVVGSSAYGNSSPFDSTYFITALDFGSVNNPYNYQDSLYFNLWHEYIHFSPDLQKGWANLSPGDLLTADSSRYFGQVKNILDNNSSKGLRTLMQRIKIDYLAMGQRSDYQCETENYLSERYKDYKFYTYRTVPDAVSRNYTDNSIFGNGARVRYSRTANSTNEGTWVNSQGYVVSGLKANREQINYIAYSSKYMTDQLYPWFIKPRIRIDDAFANNPANLNTNVCKIEILRFDGTVIKSVDLKVSNFIPDLQHPHYSGRYIEEFYNLPAGDSLKINPVPDPSHPDEPEYNTNPFNPGRKSEWDEKCAVDFRVWWYGSCDMWLDYVRVENLIADNLFKGNHDNWINWEVRLANYNNSPAEFYIEEFQFNMVPCMSYIAKKIREYSNGKFNLMCVLNWGEYILHQPDPLKHQFDLNYIKRNLVDTLQLREFCDFAYPFNGYKEGMPDFNTPVYVPSTLNPGGYSVPDGRLTLDTVPEAYDRWLQDYLDKNTSWGNDNFIKWMKHGDAISKLCGIPFINLPQAHSFYYPAYIHSEPTNEEIQMMVNISVTYGARGQLYFWYGNWGKIGSDSYGRGMTGGNPDPGPAPRTANVYGQNKWTAIKDINRKLNAWGPTLMSFNNTGRRSYIFRDENERYSLIKDSYFRWIVTGKPGSHQDACPEWHQGVPAPSPEAGLVYDCGQFTYLQAATFENSEPDTYYFMIVNRRCSPYYAPGADPRFPDGENGGRRKVKILFDTDNPQMSASARWKITEVGNPSASYIFDKTANSYIDLGWFMPAEGKLYKLEPAG